MFNGVFLSQCNNAIVKNNYFMENNGDGVYLDSYNCMVFDNYFKGNRRGLTITRSGCEIINNDIYSSTASGVYAMYGSTDNLIYLNHFLRNGKSAEEKGNNQWYHGTKGNYWSDYNEVDRDLDGIGDTFYTKEGVLDKYPLGYFLKPPNKPSDPDPGDGDSGVGLIITLEVYVSDPDSEMLDVYFYKAVDDSLIGIDKRVLNNSVGSYTFKQAFNTTFVWYAIAKDGDLENRSDTWFFITRTTPPDNKPPVADAGGPYEGWLNQAITFDASKSYDPDGDIDFHRWNFGDGTSEILAVSPKHVYRNPGSYEVTLTVIDDDGSSDMVKTIATIFGSSTDQKPIADAGGPYFCNVGQLVILDGSESSDPDGTITNYSWIFDDETSNYGNPSTHSFSKPGTYTVQLIVTDNSGYKATNTTIITVEYKESYKETSGFELLLLVMTVVVILFWNRKRIK
jgi:parallel beta-helix repeat protein